MTLSRRPNNVMVQEVTLQQLTHFGVRKPQGGDRYTLSENVLLQ